MMSGVAASSPIIEVVTRPEIAYGLDCLWWGPLADAKHEATPLGDRFSCPKCGGRAGTHPDEATFMALARRFEQIGFAGHQALIKFVKGSCYKSRSAAWGAFIAAGRQL